MRPSAGRVIFATTELTALPARKLAALGVARTFQHIKLRPNMTVVDNVMLGAYCRTRSGFVAGSLRLDRREETELRAEAMRQLGRVGLGRKANDLAGNLPLGQQRVLEVARALASDPMLVMLDEPAAGLRQFEEQCRTLLNSLRASGLSLLLVEHDMDFVMGLVDRIVMVDFGRKLAEGQAQAIRDNPAVQEASLGASREPDPECA